MTFYDYDMEFQRDGNWLYMLRAGGKKLPNRSYCRVWQEGEKTWMRKTCWRGAKGGIRYEGYNSLDDALLAGIKWARRRERADKRENAR